MNLSNYFWCFKSALTPRFCDEVIKYALEKKDTMALTGGYRRDKNKPLNKKYFDALKINNSNFTKTVGFNSVSNIETSSIFPPK